jgi:hypothetical protein
MFSEYASGSHISMRVSKALGPRTRRSKVAPEGAKPNAAAVSRVITPSSWPTLQHCPRSPQPNEPNADRHRRTRRSNYIRRHRDLRTSDSGQRRPRRRDRWLRRARRSGANRPLARNPTRYRRTGNASSRMSDAAIHCGQVKSRMTAPVKGCVVVGSRNRFGGGMEQQDCTGVDGCSGPRREEVRLRSETPTLSVR